MAKAFVVWDGLAEFEAELRKLPESLTVEALHEIESAANAAFVDITGAYPVRTGNLRKGMRLKPVQRNGFFVKATVQNVAPHALIFENGTQARHYFTRNGVKHLLGQMPPGRVFVPRVIRWRGWLTERLIEMVKRHGATVTGDA